MTETQRDRRWRRIRSRTESQKDTETRRRDGREVRGRSPQGWKGWSESGPEARGGRGLLSWASRAGSLRGAAAVPGAAWRGPAGTGGEGRGGRAGVWGVVWVLEGRQREGPLSLWKGAGQGAFGLEVGLQASGRSLA